MANQEIEFFDLASKGTNKCWSLNPWKTRLVLNYKAIPYKTTWLEYPAIAPTFQELKIPPNAEGMAYTIPTVRLADGTCIMDSAPIAAALEKLYPSPPLHLDDPIHKELEPILTAFITPLRPVVMPKVPRNLLNAGSAEYFERTRAERFGMPLAEFEKSKGEDGKEAWAEAEPHVRALGALLKRHGGPFFLGDTVCYADMIVVGALQFFKRIGEGNLFDKAVAMEPSLGTLYEASAKMLERDTY